MLGIENNNGSSDAAGREDQRAVGGVPGMAYEIGGGSPVPGP
jgi:hypothetical protein